MENTNPKKLRAKLKEYLDMAKKEAIRIKRKSGQSYILISEEKFNELKHELTSLQKRLLGKVPAAAEKVKESTKSKKVKTTKKAPVVKTTKKTSKKASKA